MGNFNPGIIDANKQVVKAFPAAGANHNTTTIDLQHVQPGTPPHGTELIISVPAMAAHSDNSKSYTLQLQDSADDSSYANVDPAISTTVLGVTSTGTPAKEIRFPIPSTCRRYVQVYMSVQSAGPTLTGTSITVSAVAPQV